MPNEEITLMKSVQRKLANIAATAQSTRGQVPKGTLHRIIPFLADMELGKLHDIKSRKEFEVWLDNVSDEMQNNVFRNGNFGGARKVINIFLELVHLSLHLKPHLPDAIRPYLEVPLDRHVVTGLEEDCHTLGLANTPVPVWLGVKYLTPELCKQYQDMATVIAGRYKILRVELDLKYWRRDYGEAFLAA